MKFLEGDQCCEKAVWPDRICPECQLIQLAYQYREDELYEEVAEDHVHGILPECPEDVGCAE